MVNTSNPQQVFLRTDNTWLAKSTALVWDMSPDTFFRSYVWTCVTYGNGTFVMISAGASDPTKRAIRASPDGKLWSNRTTAAASYWQSVACGAGLLVAVANSGTRNRVMTSSNSGKTWTVRNSSWDSSWMSIMFSNGLFVAVGYEGACMTSPEGTE